MKKMKNGLGILAFALPIFILLISSKLSQFAFIGITELLFGNHSPEALAAVAIVLAIVLAIISAIFLALKAIFGRD